MDDALASADYPARRCFAQTEATALVCQANHLRCDTQRQSIGGEPVRGTMQADIP